jgi:tetratricopeptide (TPR) repeat protein
MLQRGEEATRLAREAIDALGDEHPAERGLAYSAFAAGLALQDSPEADAAFRQATELLQQHGHQIDVADAYRAWARYLRGAGRESEALDVLDRATELGTSARTKTLG